MLKFKFNKKEIHNREEKVSNNHSLHNNFSRLEIRLLLWAPTPTQAGITRK
jgi:hypothetical protein